VVVSRPPQASAVKTAVLALVRRFTPRLQALAMVAQPATAAAADMSAAAADAASDTRLPWYDRLEVCVDIALSFPRSFRNGAIENHNRYRRYTRWRQTSRAEAVAAESSLLSLSGYANYAVVCAS
jgi:hypothetical protein